MRDCQNCNNRIPDGMKICPHCGKLPMRLTPSLPLYGFLAIVAMVSAFLFRPFAYGPYIGEVGSGMLWVAFCIFCVFAFIFISVCVILINDYTHRTVREKLSKEEISRFVKMKQHIESGRHYYDAGSKYCSVCGKKK